MRVTANSSRVLQLGGLSYTKFKRLIQELLSVDNRLIAQLPTPFALNFY